MSSRPQLLLMLMMAAGCGRVGYDAQLDASNAASDGPQVTDGGREIDAADADGAREPDGPRVVCDWTRPEGPSLSAPVRLANLAEPSLDPVFTADPNFLIFAVFDTSFDFRGARRAAEGEPFFETDDFLFPNSEYDDTHLELSSDFKTAYFSSNRPGGEGGYDLWIASRESTSEPFSDPRVITSLSSQRDEFDPHITADELTLWFAPTLPSGEQDLYFSTRSSKTETFPAATWAKVINSPQGDADPSLTADGRVIVFVSNRSGINQIWYATRSSRSDEFGEPALVADLASGTRRAQAFVRSDGCEILFWEDDSIFLSTFIR